MPEMERVSAQSSNFDIMVGSRPARKIVSVPVEPRPCLVEEAAYVPAANVDLGEQLPDDPIVLDFVQAVLAPEDSAVKELVARLLENGLSLQSLYLDLLAPAARMLGQMWQDDDCDFVEVTIGVGRLQLVLRDMSQMFVRTRPRDELAGRVLLSSLPGEQHSLGLFMVAEFFVRDGWEVKVGPPVSEKALLAEVGAEWYDVVGFSVSCDSRLDHLKRQIRRIRDCSLNREVLILVGGRAFHEQPGLLERIGADATANNAELAPECVRRLLTT